MVKDRASWKHAVRALAGSSPGVLSEQLPVRNGIPRLATLAPDAPRPIKVYIDLELRLVWCLYLAKTTRIANGGQWPILACVGTIIYHRCPVRGVSAT